MVSRVVRCSRSGVTVGVLFFSFGLAPLFGQDAPDVSSTLSATSVSAGETVVLQIVAITRGAAPTIEVPPLSPELTVVGSRDYTEMQMSFPGGRSRTVRREIVLRTTVPGTFQIPPVTVRADGVARQTLPLSLAVTGTGRLPFSTPFPAAGTAPEVMLNVHLSADTVFVGEQVTLTTETLVSERVRVRLRRAPEYTPPNMSGFWLHELPRASPQTRALGNQYYEVQTLGRGYFPISAGEYTIPPAKLIYEVRSGFLSGSETHELASDTLRLVVLPIPEAGRPASYAGAVGRYEMDATIAPTQLASGEPAMLRVEIRGEGNVKALPPPRLQPIPGAQIYPPTEESEVRVVDGRVTGHKRFTWVILPERPGHFELPPIEYSFFDPEARTFSLSTSSSLVLAVVGGDGPVSPERLTLAGPRPADSALGRLGWVSSRTFAAAQAVPLLALLWALWWRSARDRPRSASRRKLRAGRHSLTARLSALATADPAAFLRAALDETRAWIAARLGRPELSVASPAMLGRALQDHGVAPDTTRPLVALLERVEHARFEEQPPPSGVLAVTARELARLLELVDQQARRAEPVATPGADSSGDEPSSGGSDRVGAVLTIALTLALATGASALRADAVPAARVLPVQESAAEAFRAGLAALEARDPAEAVRGFSAALAADPEHPAAWYNLGNACFATGDRGCAIWAWLNALRLQPRLAAARHNLNVAGFPPDAAATVLPLLPLSDSEILLLVSLAWLLGAVLLMWRLLARQPVARWPAATALGLAALLMASWSVPHLGRPTAVVMTSGTSLQASPNLRAEAVIRIPAGETVRMLELRGDGWVRVVASSGAEGWLEQTQVRQVGPAAEAARLLTPN